MPENTTLIYSFKVIFLHLLRSSISEVGNVKEKISQQNSNTNCYANSHSSLWTAVRWLACILAAPLTTRASLEAGLLRHNGSSRNQRDRNLKKKIFTKRNTNWVFCLFNKSLQGTCFNWIATSTAKQIIFCKMFPQAFQGVKPVTWLKTELRLCVQVRCNYALLLSFWGISWNVLFIFHRRWRLE